MRALLRSSLLVLLLAALLGGCGNTASPRAAAPTAATGLPSSPPSTASSSITASSATAPDAAVTNTAASGEAASAPATTTTLPAATVEPATTPPPLTGAWWDSAVCYEVFVRSFYDSNGDGIGDFNGLIEKLDYINDGDPSKQDDLGANCIWLMPVAEGPTYHGYHVTDYYNVEADYGTNDDFKRLVSEAHRRGIKVVIDLVLNHSAREHPWFQDALANPESPYRDWYIWSENDPGYAGPSNQQVWHKSPVSNEYYYGVFNEQIPDLNFRNPAVTEEAQKISAFWLTEMGVDGFRLDAIKHLIEDGPVQENTPETLAWLREYRTFLGSTKADAFTIGEIFDANTSRLAPYYPDQLDSYFHFEVANKLIEAAKLSAAGQFTIAVNNAYTNLPAQRWAPFLTNHDQPRVMNAFGGDVDKAKVAATGLLTLPGLPFLYYGEEIGMVGTKPDENIRTPMQWDGGPGGGFTNGKPWRPFQSDYGEVNVAAQSADEASLLNLYRRLVHLHTAEPALAQGSYLPVKASSPQVSAFVRQAGDEAILVVLHFGRNPAEALTLSVGESQLAPGTYQLRSLLGDAAAASLTIGANGAVENYIPLPSLAPKTGYIFKLEK